MFRYDPPSVGFAELSTSSLAMDDDDGTVPTPTIGSPVVVATGQAPGLVSRDIRLEMSLNPVIAISILWITSLVFGVSL